MEQTEYELVMTIKTETTDPLSGIDSEPIMIGSGLSVIRRILRDDDSVSGYKLVKR